MTNNEIQWSMLRASGLRLICSRVNALQDAGEKTPMESVNEKGQ